MLKTPEPMTTGPIWKRMLLFAFPLFLGNLFQQLYNTVDSLIVGNFLGSSALAAVSSSDTLINMLVGFFNGMATGAGIVVARLYGAQDKENLNKSVHTTVAFGLVASITLTVLGYIFAPQILRWTGTPETVLPNSLVYMKIYFLGSVGFVMFNIFMGILQAVGDSRHPLYYLMTSSVINLVLDVVFIKYLKTGIGGAAFATIISQGLSALLCLAQLMLVKDDYRVSLKKIRFHKEILKEIISIGLPTGVQNSIIAFANLVVQSYVNSFGEMAMAGIGTSNKIEGFVFLPINSFNLALSTFVGQNRGAENFERAKKGARFGIITTVSIAEAIGLIYFTFAPQLISLFDKTPEVIMYGTANARAATIFYFFLAFSHAIASILRGAGKAVVPMVIMLVCWCVIRVIFLSITIPLTHSISMLYWVYPLTWGLSSAAYLYYYKKMDWNNLNSRN